MIHPNLIPVVCDTQDDIRKLAEVMRNICLKDVHVIEDYIASDTETEALNRSKAMEHDILDSGNLRFVETPDGKITNVVFTLQETKNNKIWNMSISHATTSGPLRVDDELATFIVDAFLEKDYEEVEPKAIWKNVRHFVKPMI